MGGSGVNSVQSVAELITANTSYCSWLLKFLIVAFDESYLWKKTGRKGPAEYAALVKPLVDLLLAGPCKYIMVSLGVTPTVVCLPRPCNSVSM